MMVFRLETPVYMEVLITLVLEQQTTLLPLLIINLHLITYLLVVGLNLMDHTHLAIKKEL